MTRFQKIIYDFPNYFEYRKVTDLSKLNSIKQLPMFVVKQLWDKCWRYKESDVLQPINKENVEHFDKWLMENVD